MTMTAANDDPGARHDFATAIEAIWYAHAHRPVAITVGGRHRVVSPAEAERLKLARIEFAYLAEVNGRVVTIPANE
jgi:hypothetical protein